MLLTISTTHEPATDLGFLLHKHPDRWHRFDLSFGRAHVFYPEATDAACTACLLLDVDSVGLVRAKDSFSAGLLDQYVNDRPYVASSLMSVAISQVLGSALGGRSKDRPELAGQAIPLTARIDVLPVPLRNRGLGAKRSLALREFALGIEAIERFVRREPLRRVHECVFGVLALESEPVDPRL